MSIYDLLLNPQKNPADYFIQSQQAVQNHEINQQQMAAKAQQMQQMADMHPLQMADLQAQTTGRGATTRYNQALSNRLEKLTTGEKTLQEQNISKGEFEADTRQEVYNTNRDAKLAEIAEQRRATKHAKAKEAGDLTLQEQNIAAGDRAAETHERQINMENIGLMGNLAEEIIPMGDEEGRWQLVQEFGQALNIPKKDLRNVDLGDMVNMRNSLKKHNQKDDRIRKGKTILVSEDGQDYFSTNLLNLESGEATTVKTPTGGKLISNLGETAEEKTQRKGKEAGLVQLSKMTVEQQGEYANVGLSAADSLEALSGSLSILNEGLETGFTSGLALKAKNFFGVEGADEGELSYNLAINVMQQLKPIFGSQFTVEEGKWLQGAEAGLSKSPEANKRIIELAMKRAKRIAQRGIRAAKESGNDFLAEEIQEQLDSLTSSQSKGKAQQKTEGDEDIYKGIKIIN